MRQLVSGVDGVDEPADRSCRPHSRTSRSRWTSQKARAEGIKPGDVRRAEATLLQGIEVGSVFEDQKVFEVIVKGTPETRRNVASVRNLLIDKPDGGHVRLGDVADVRVAQTPAVIKRDAVSRYLDVEGRRQRAQPRRRRERHRGPPRRASACRSSTTRRCCRRPPARRSTRAAMLAFALGCAIAIFLLLQAAFGGWRLAALAFLTLPVALVGRSGRER